MEQQLQQLARIYNTLCLISTKGEDTMTMADCLRALKEVYEQLSAQNNSEGE